MGSMQAGSMFGEVALLHTLRRTATVVTKSQYGNGSRVNNSR